MSSSEMDPNTTPASAPPPGVTPDFNSPVDSADLFYAISSVGLALAAFTVLLKLYIRIFIHKKIGTDDVLTVVTLGLQAAYVALVDNMALHGNLRHQWDITLANYMEILNLQNRTGVVQIFALMFAKLALLALFYRIFSPRAMYKWLIIATGVAIIITYLVFAFIFIFVKAATNLQVLLNTNNALGIVGVLSDVGIAILPISAIFSLNLPLSKKIGVGAIFGTGMIAVAMSILSCYYRFSETSSGKANDNTYHFSERSAIQAVEIDIAIIVGCVPILPSLVNRSTIRTWFSNTFTSLRRLIHSRNTTDQVTNDKSDGYYYHLPDGRRQPSHDSGDSTTPAIPLGSVQGRKIEPRADIHPYHQAQYQKYNNSPV